jgi:hypothetical protein
MKIDIEFSFDNIKPMKTNLTLEEGLYVHEGEPVDDLLDAVEMDRESRVQALWEITP